MEWMGHFWSCGAELVVHVRCCREHEQMSVALLDDILADNLHGISEGDLAEEDIGHVKAMIVSGKGGSPAPAGKRWLYEVRWGVRHKSGHTCACMPMA